MADDARRQARRARAGIDVALRRALLRRRPLHGAAAGRCEAEPRAHRRPDRLADAVLVGAGVDDDAALRVAARDGEEGGAQECGGTPAPRPRSGRRPRRRRAAPRRARAPAPAADRAAASDPAGRRRRRPAPAGREAAARAARPRPDRRASNRRSGRTRPRRRASAPGGSARRYGRCARPRRRCASAAGPCSRSRPDRISARKASACGVPPGSRVATVSSPSARSRAARRRACADLPAPSPPSRVMKRPRVTPFPGAAQPIGAELPRRVGGAARQPAERRRRLGDQRAPAASTFRPGRCAARRASRPPRPAPARGPE